MYQVYVYVHMYYVLVPRTCTSYLYYVLGSNFVITPYYVHMYHGHSMTVLCTCTITE